MNMKPMRKFECHKCPYVYHEYLGDEESGIPEGTEWDKIPNTWNCPFCRMSKNEFEMVKKIEEDYYANIPNA